MRAARLIVFSLRAIAFLAFLTMLAAFAGVLRAQSLDDGARELARKVRGNLELHEGDALTLAELQNHSSLAQAQVAGAFKAFGDELRSKGVQWTIAAGPAPGPSVTVFFSENASSYLWIAVIRRDVKAEAVLVASVSRSALPPEPIREPAVMLRKQFLWSQREQILDVALLGPPVHKESRMAILEPEQVVFYRMVQGYWQREDAAALQHAYPWPRDLRGRLADSTEGLKVFLPGTVCDVTAEKVANAACKENNGPWPVAFGPTFSREGPLSARRNFFVGSGNADGMPPTYSLASVGMRTGPVSYVATLVDGRTLLYEDSATPVATFTGWGSDVARLRTDCGGGWQILVTRPGDWMERDSLQAFEIAERQAVPVSDVVEFAGPVTALWPQAGDSSAIAVSRNLKTGQYEAYTLSITCSH